MRERLLTILCLEKVVWCGSVDGMRGRGKQGGRGERGACKIHTSSSVAERYIQVGGSDTHE